MLILTKLSVINDFCDSNILKKCFPKYCFYKMMKYQTKRAFVRQNMSPKLFYEKIKGCVLIRKTTMFLNKTYMVECEWAIFNFLIWRYVIMLLMDVIFKSKNNFLWHYHKMTTLFSLRDPIFSWFLKKLIKVHLFENYS